MKIHGRGEYLLAVVAIVSLASVEPVGAQNCQQPSGVFSSVLIGSTSGSSAESGSCGGAAAPEATFFYTAPRAGLYTIDTLGSGFDTVLYVRNNMGTELSCNDDIAPATESASRVTLTLAQGQFVMIIVDGFGTQSGSFTLHINGNCPRPSENDPRDLGLTLSISVSGSTDCASFLASGSMCGDGGANAPDATFLYTAPTAGKYTIDTVGSSFDTLLSVRSGSCNGPEIICNDDIDPPTNQQSAVTLQLETAQLLLIAVDGFDMASGGFTLNIHGTPFTPTATRTAANTRTASRTATTTPTRTGSATRTSTRTRTLTPTTTATRTRTPTRSPSASRTLSASATATTTLGPPTSTRTRTAVASATATPSSGPSRSPTNSHTPSRTVTPPLTPSVTATAPSSPSATPTSELTATPTRTVALTPISTVSSTQTPSPVIGQTPTSTPTASGTAPRPPTATPTASGTAIRSATASAAPTATPSPSRMATPTPTVPRGPVSYCVARGTGFRCRIDFEQLPAGHVPHPLETITDQFRTATGISFPDAGAAIRPLAGTSSPDVALRNGASATVEPNPGPLVIAFDGIRVTRLALRVGLDQTVGGVQPILTAFDADGATSQDAAGAVLPDGPTPIDEPIEIVPTGFFISRAELHYDGATASAREAVEVIDDLEVDIEGPPPCPPNPDTEGPIVTLTSPDDTSESQNLPQLTGMISESSGTLLHVTAEVTGSAGSYAVDLSPFVMQNRGNASQFSFSVSNLDLFAGANRITIDAGDGGCPPNRNGAVFDVDDVTPPANMNLYAMALEVTQSIQDQLQVREVAREGTDPMVFAPIPYAGIPLVANKRTIVRAYAEVQDTVRPVAAVHGVPAQLIVRRDGGETDLVASGITIDPADQVNAGGMRDVDRTLANKRGSILKSWNFELPDALTAPGTIGELELRVNPEELAGPSECAGCNDAANRLRVSAIPFTQVATMSMRTFYLAQDVDVAMMPGADSRTFCGPLLRMFPVADGCGTGPINRNDFSFGINLLSLIRLDPKVNMLVGPDLRAVDVGTAQGRMCETMYWDGLHTIPGFTPPADYFGVVPSGVPTTGGFSGMGGPNHGRYFPSACSSGIEANWPVAAQEIGHGMLVRDVDGTDISSCAWHAPCGSPACPLASFPDYTDPLGTLYPSASIGEFGLDTQTLTVFDPNTTYDFMSYCGPVWTSPFSYRIMFTHFRNRLAATDLAFADGAGVSEREYVVTYGILDDQDHVMLGPFYRTTLTSGTDDETGSGAYSLELQDEVGGVLFVRHFDFAPPAAHEGSGPRPPQSLLPPRFRETVPWDPATKQIVCKHGDTVVATRVVSDNEPSVVVTSPNGGEAWAKDDTPTIRWTAADADGDALQYKVEYSTDGGDNWRTLSTDLTTDSLAVTAAFLPGSDMALVRVSATDGVNTAVDRSDATFAVARKDASLAISGVADDAIVDAGTVLNLIANYVDPNEEGIAEESFVWRAPGLGVLGIGSRLALPAMELPPGPHRITVTVPGQDGPPVSAAVNILRAPRLRELLAACSGDCNGDGSVSTAELVLGVRIALDNLPLERCLPADAGGDGALTVDELVAAVGHALNACEFAR